MPCLAFEYRPQYPKLLSADQKYALNDLVAGG